MDAPNDTTYVNVPRAFSDDGRPYHGQQDLDAAIALHAARAAAEGVIVRQVDARTWEAQGVHRATPYTLVLDRSRPSLFACNCQAGLNGRLCKHAALVCLTYQRQLAAVAAEAERTRPQNARCWTCGATRWTFDPVRRTWYCAECFTDYAPDDGHAPLVDGARFGDLDPVVLGPRPDEIPDWLH